MTSVLSKADVEDELVRAGIRSPYVRARLLRYIEQYARKYPVPRMDDLPPVVNVDFQGYKYRCPECKERRFLGEFPEYKKEHTRAPVPCIPCGKD